MDELKKMVDEQIIARGIKDPVLIDALLNIPRKLFIPEENQYEAYRDGPVSIGEGQTISQPYIVAVMTELLQLSKTDRVLEIGTGSGYQTAMLARICKEVYTVEIRENLSLNAQNKLASLRFSNIKFKVGSGYDGWEEFAPYDKIIVTCAPHALPENLLKQLNINGRMVLPVETTFFHQDLIVLINSPDGLKQENHGGVIFVPMVKKIC